MTAAVPAVHLAADDRPPVTNPRATDGDARIEPDWDERFTLTVGTKRGDLIGSSDRVLQAAVDCVARRGGGTVQLLEGTFVLRNAVFLPSGIRLQGRGDDTVLTRGPSESVSLAADSDWYDQEITLQQAGGFRPGDGVTLFGTDPRYNRPIVIKRTLTARSGNRFRLNDGLRENLWLAGRPRCTSLFPLLTSERTSDIVIGSLVLDGNGAQCENLNGNYGGCIFLQDCVRCTIDAVTARNYNGDGISFQVCHDVVVKNCFSHDNADLGLHPGSGSQRPLIQNNRLHRNSLGLFWCWGVRYGLAEDNDIAGNRRYGISIGHSDTDNLMRRNRISDSGQAGILFRSDPRGKNFQPDRNTIEQNEIINSGGPEGVAIDITGPTRDLTITGNTLIEQRSPANRIGIRIDDRAGPMQIEGNSITGFRTAIADYRRKSS